MSEDAITIRRAETIADYRACQEAQRLAWGITDESYIVPLATMVGAQHHGGLVLGAFNDTGRALGLSFGFLGRIEGRLCLYSQLTGVVPGLQGRGLGNRLKAAQRDFARSEGLSSLAWAFDPLQAGNARFNLEHLGATASKFVEDMYGRRSDALNAGSATDRLIAEWPADPGQETRPAPPPDPDRLPRLIEFEATGHPVASREIPDDHPEVLIEIPARIADLRKDQPSLADAWSLAVRRAFRIAFEAGYRAEGFHREGLESRPRCYYRLIRRRLDTT